MKPKFLIADDHPIFIKGIIDIISENNLGEILGQVHNGKELLQRLNSCNPNFIILDINMPLINGLEAAKIITEKFSNVHILVISMNEDFTLIEKLKKIGVHGFIPKSFENIDLKEAIQSIIKGESYFPNLTEHKEDPSNNKLTSRETEVIRLILDGKSTKEIAEILKLSTFTIDTHRKNIGRKTGAKTALQLSKIILDSH